VAYSSIPSPLSTPQDRRGARGCCGVTAGLNKFLLQVGGRYTLRISFGNRKSISPEEYRKSLQQKVFIKRNSFIL
jgi:hypothetical protein